MDSNKDKAEEGQKTDQAVTTSGAVVVPAGSPMTIPASFKFTDEWLRDFYKECGRETTLAYTTLNQMKNWAIVIDGAIVAAVMAAAKNTTSDTKQIWFVVFCGSAAAFIFTFRFFIRAILCYINLLRWNTLQERVVRARLVGVASKPNDPPTEAERSLVEAIQNFYLDWLATINRPAQLVHNLKLGFALLFAIPLPFLIGGAISLWSDPYVRAITVFVAGVTATEIWDFLGSRMFDTPEVAKARKKHKQASVFPLPPKRWGYVVGIVLSTLTAVAVANWAEITRRWPTTPPQEGIILQPPAVKGESAATLKKRSTH